MTGGVILFILEGPSDETALVTFVAEYLKKNKIRTTVKCMHGDILTETFKNTRVLKLNHQMLKLLFKVKLLIF